MKRVDTEIRDDQDILKYSSTFAQSKFDPSKSLWEWHVQENYTKDTSLIFFVIQHGLFDRIGFVSLMSCLWDNQFQLKMKKKFVPITWYWKIFYITFRLFFAAYIGAKIKDWTTDKKAQKMLEKNNNTSDKMDCYSTK